MNDNVKLALLKAGIVMGILTFAIVVENFDTIFSLIF